MKTSPTVGTTVSEREIDVVLPAKSDDVISNVHEPADKFKLLENDDVSEIVATDDTTVAPLVAFTVTTMEFPLAVVCVPATVTMPSGTESESAGVLQVRIGDVVSKRNPSVTVALLPAVSTIVATAT